MGANKKKSNGDKVVVETPQAPRALGQNEFSAFLASHDTPGLSWWNDNVASKREIFLPFLLYRSDVIFSQGVGFGTFLLATLDTL